ncbi:Hpt domain-containing protein [Maribacter chungangensis]|uniref:Hpt domain-containing protein n=1 Tax=Maribacter chungangensis TaxID=1069117 RepID=A0ABW3B5H2_9FLAO
MDKPNMDYILQLAGGDSEFEQQFINILKEEFPKEKEQYLTAMETADYKQASELVHKLKHKFNILGMETAYQLSVKFEDELKQNTIGLNSEFVKVLELMEGYIKKI